jgi:hypothetical protein
VSEGDTKELLEKAELNLKLAEIELKLKQADREELEQREVEARVEKLEREKQKDHLESNRWSSKRGWVPTSQTVFRALGAGLGLAGAAFFLYSPIVDTVRAKVTWPLAKVNLRYSKLRYKKPTISSLLNKMRQ